MYAGGNRIEKKKTVKRQIRDTKRLLSREGLPETVRQTKERMLKSLQQELTDKETEKRSTKVAKKYRMIKFFERRKLSRKLKSKLKEYSACTDTQERSKLLEELHFIRKELNYVINYPEEEKYIALYPSSKTTSDKATTRKKKLLEEIMIRVEDGQLPDAAETEAQWSTIVTMDTTSTYSLTRDLSVGSSSSGDDGHLTDSDEHMKYKSCKISDLHKKQRTKNIVGATVHTAHKRQLVPVDQEPISENEVFQTRKQLKEDDFFLIPDTK